MIAASVSLNTLILVAATFISYLIIECSHGIAIVGTIEVMFLVLKDKNVLVLDGLDKCTKKVVKI